MFGHCWPSTPVIGTQGDIWDAHKDMTLALIGSLIAIIVTAAISIERLLEERQQENKESDA